jgi:hypothetical protein
VGFIGGSPSIYLLDGSAVPVMRFEGCNGAGLTGAESGQCIAAVVTAFALLISIHAAVLILPEA